MNILADNTPDGLATAITRTWNRNQETILVGLYFTWFIMNGSIYGDGDKEMVISYFGKLYNLLQCKYLQPSAIYFRSGPALKKKFEVLKKLNKESERVLLRELASVFFDQYRGYELFVLNVLRFSDVGLPEHEIRLRLSSLETVSFNNLNVPEYGRQERVNSWYAIENALLLRAVARFFLRYGSFSPPRINNDDTRKTWVQVYDIFQSIKTDLPGNRYPERTVKAVERHFKSLKSEEIENLHIYFLLSYQSFNRVL